MTDAQVAELTARMQITDIIADLALGLDLGEWERYEACFADDLEVRNPHFSGPEVQHHTARSWMQAVRSRQAYLDSRYHTLTTPRIELRGDEARVVLLQQARFRLAGTRGSEVYALGGSLRLGLVRRLGRWRIHRLEFEVLWSEGNWAVFEEAGRRGRVAGREGAADDA